MTSFVEHMNRLKAVSDAIKFPRLTQCRFAYEGLLFLTQIISKDNVHPDLQKTGAIASVLAA